MKNIGIISKFLDHPSYICLLYDLEVHFEVLTLGLSCSSGFICNLPRYVYHSSGTIIYTYRVEIYINSASPSPILSINSILSHADAQAYTCKHMVY